ncbi:MAG: ferritin-like domain-containing protein [Pseudomonadota bacterium]|nr:ferritin-like domain-containing protein [Pseudomonadota bacterium]
MRPISHMVRSAFANANVLEDAGCSQNPRVLKRLLGPALRGLLFQRGKNGDETEMDARHDACFTWTYTHDAPAMRALLNTARRGQWDPLVDLDWSLSVDPLDPERPFVDERASPLQEVPGFSALDPRTKRLHQRDLLAWSLSQFLHGEQGALYVACQLTEAVSWTDAKLFGSTQVVDEGRHVEVFDRYLAEKLEKRYPINDNLYVMLDALMTDRRWDLKFLGMQVIIEGLALGAFGTLRTYTHEPLLRELLRRVITDEARHVHFGVLALQRTYADLPEPDRHEREDWAYEMCVLLRNRFLAHEFYDEHWAHRMGRRSWNRAMLESQYMSRFRDTMFRRIVPNLKRIGLLSARIRPRYERLGLLTWEHERAAPDLTIEEMVEG